jgi:hypothetical protein
VELVEGGADSHAQVAPEPETAAQHGAGSLPTATAEYDYEAAEENELSFPDGATITNIVSLPSLTNTWIRVLTRFRNSPTRIGGRASTMASLDCSPPTMSNCTSDSVGCRMSHVQRESVAPELYVRRIR